MKISVLEGADGFELFQTLCRRGSQVEITLDGSPIPNVVDADTEAGVIRVFETDHTGRLIGEMAPAEEEFALPTFTFRKKIMRGVVDILENGGSLTKDQSTTNDGETSENHN